MKRSLKKRTAIGIAAIALVLTLTAVCISYGVYVRTMDEHYAIMAQNVADTAALGIDGDKIQQYYEEFLKLDKTAPDYNEKLQAVKDEDYNRMLQYLYDVRKANGALFLYIEVYDFENMLDTYIMDADEKETACDLGYTGVIAAERAVYKGALEEGILPFFTNTAEFGPLVTSGRPIYNSRGEVIALAMVDLSMQKVWDDRVAYLILISAIMLGSAMALVALFVYMSNKTMVRPINRLAHAAQSYVSDKVRAVDGISEIEQLDIQTGDEVENLCESIKKMEQDIRTYIHNLTAVTAEKERIGAELDVAKQIQASMLPSIFPAFPERPELDIYATMTPAKEVGGDFYDFFLIDDDHLAMVMADVSGKGVPAALFMVIAKTLIKNVAQAGLPPKSVLEKVNKQLCVGNDAEMFVTVWIGILEISTGKLICANAGHEYPVLKRADGGYELLRDKHGFVLAGMEHSRYAEYELLLQPGDRIFLYTDGVPEATNTDNELYGNDRMLAALNRTEMGDCKQLLSIIKEDIDAFVGQAPQFDDITMLSLTLMPADTFGMQKLKLPPSLEAMAEVTAFVEQGMEDAGLPMKLIAQMNIAVDEIFSNIVRYSGATDATVGVKVSNGVLTLRFADNGLPYDPTATVLPDTTLSAEEREIGGLGLLMVKKFMDTVEYEYHDGLNILTLKKKID